MSSNSKGYVSSSKEFGNQTDSVQRSWQEMQHQMHVVWEEKIDSSRARGGQKPAGQSDSFQFLNLNVFTYDCSLSEITYEY